MGNAVREVECRRCCQSLFCKKCKTELRNIESDGFHQFNAIAGGDHAGTETIVKGKPVIFKAFLEVNIANLRGEDLFERSKSKIMSCDKADSAITNQRTQHTLRAHAPIMRVGTLQNFIEQEQ